MRTPELQLMNDMNTQSAARTKNRERMTMQNNILTKQQARVFMLMKQGLYGDYIFSGKPGALDYVKQAGCIQFDPVDSVGKNAELTLQSRVKGFRKKDLYDLLYQDRSLVDYFDKELSIIPTEDWPYFKRYRDLCEKNGHRFPELKQLEDTAIRYIREKGNVSFSSLPIDGAVKWYSSIHWSGSWEGNATKASRSVLEQLYTTGDLVIHHKEGSRKYYDLAERHIPEKILYASEPIEDDFEHIKWRILRRIGAVGLLWNKNSAAFLGIWDLNTETRIRAFEELARDGFIEKIQVEGIKADFFIQKGDSALLEAAGKETHSNRLEFLAPLDPMLWDRRLIEKIFDYKYTWEIYIPREKRQYGYYVLPVIFGDKLIGRIEPVISDKVLKVNNFWLEPGIRYTKKMERALLSRLRKFGKFNGCIFDETKIIPVTRAR